MFKPVTKSSKCSWVSSCLGPVLAMVAVGFAAPVWAQTTYKCGSSYSQSPCEGGAALNTEDKRTAEQKVQAQNAAKKEKQVADNLEQSRLAQEKRVAADLKKTNTAKKKVITKPDKTTVRPIKNKNVKQGPGVPAQKPAPKSQGKKGQAVADEK